MIPRVLNLESFDMALQTFVSSSLIMKMRAIQQYFPMGLFIMLYWFVLTFESVDEILKCDH